MSDSRRKGRGGKDRYRKVRRAIAEAEARFPFVEGNGKGRANRKARRALILEARREVAE